MPQALAAILFFHGECVNLKISQLQLQLFFSIWVFFHEHSQFTGQQEKGEVICLTGLYHFHLNISPATKAETSFLRIATCRARTRNFDCCTPSQLQLFIKYRISLEQQYCRYFYFQAWLQEQLLSLLFWRICSLYFCKGSIFFFKAPLAKVSLYLKKQVATGHPFFSLLASFGESA